MRYKKYLMNHVYMALAAGLVFCCAAGAQVELVVDPAHPAGEIDLTRYSLGQGGLSVEPMFDEHLDQVAVLRPRTIRLFVQEYFDLYPEHGRYHWETLDRSIENILAAGAKPIMSLCFKPAALYPQTDQDIVHPSDYAEWEQLLEALVRHCNQEKNYGIEYWEVGNEVDLGESGGCPYRFQPEDYTTYYRHTVAAVRRAYPRAKVGGPALADYLSPIGDALIEFCGRGEAPLDFFSWHMYGNDPGRLRQSIREIKAKLAGHASLKETGTVIDEWNIKLLGEELTTGFQAAFILESTLGFWEEGLSLSSYYHIRDHFVSPEDFTWMSPEGYKFMADWWNVQVQNSGLFDKQGRRRPAYHIFEMLSHIRGGRLPVAGVTGDIHAVAALEDGTAQVLVWNFPAEGVDGEVREVTLQVSSGLKGPFSIRRLDAAANRLAEIASGALAELEKSRISLTLAPYEVVWVRLDCGAKD